MAGEAPELLVSRGERYLATCLLALRDMPEHLPPGIALAEVVRQRRIVFEVPLDVYERLGILDADAVAWWRSESGERAGQRPDPDPALARGILERLWRELPADAPAADAPVQSRASTPWARFAAALQALGAARALPHEELACWQERLDAFLRGATVDELRAERERETFTGRDLERVLVGPGPWRDGVRVCSVEIYTDGVVVVWQSQRDADHVPRSGELRVPDVTLSDDAGGEYRGGAAGAGTWFGGWRGRAVFAGSVPAQAARLFVAAGDHRHPVDLQHTDEGAIT